MTEEEKQAQIAEFKKIPKPVQIAVLWAFALGLITLVRMPAGAYAMHMSVSKTFFYGLLMLFWFVVAGSSLYKRSRWGYLGLIVLSLLPMLGVFGRSLHLLRLILEGQIASNWPETILCVVCFVQFLTTLVLFRYLFSKGARDFVWKPAA